MKIGVCPKVKQSSTLADQLKPGEWGITASGVIVHRFESKYQYQIVGGMNVHGIFITPADTWLICDDAIISGPVTITSAPVGIK